MQYYLAIDIGASSGRHILGSVRDDKIITEEIYRFKNGFSEKSGHLCWDIENLFYHIKEGMEECRKLNKIPSGMGIDTWGVDFVLLDREDRILGQPVAYRDRRTDKKDLIVSDKISTAELYNRTGIQKQIFNTIYQLMAVKEEFPEHLEKAKSFLMIPDYLHYLLTGIKSNEYTNASTTNILNVETKDWDYELITMLGLNKNIFSKPKKPGTVLGKLLGSIADEAGFSCEVVLPPTHDTASAVLAVPDINSGDNDYIYLSSGTWSLMGTEELQPNCSALSMGSNFTNEGGYDYTIRHLKNIMGLWIIQNVKKELTGNITYDYLCDMAMKADDFNSVIDVNDNRFLAPDSMIQEIKDYCIQTNQEAPEELS